MSYYEHTKYSFIDFNNVVWFQNSFSFKANEIPIMVNQ